MFISLFFKLEHNITFASYFRLGLLQYAFSAATWRPPVKAGGPGDRVSASLSSLLPFCATALAPATGTVTLMMPGAAPPPLDPSLGV